MKTIAGCIREWRMSALVEQAKLSYDHKPTDIQVYQLEKFDMLWAGIQERVPYYRKLVQDRTVPQYIKTWDDFAQFPVLTRAAIQQDVTQFIDPSHQLTGWSTTGGSTGTPFRVPYGASEGQIAFTNSWIGRNFYSINISDRLFHLWGHSHRFGTGWKKHIKQFNRSVKNTFLGYFTFSAYHLTPDRLREAGQIILRMKPAFIIGYSRSLNMLAKENAYRTNEFKKLKLKAVIGTTEAFSSLDDARFIEQVFGCPVAMEYGAAELGVMAYTHPSDGRYRVFWNSLLLEASPLNSIDGSVLITPLYPRAMPLIRYDIGDSVRNAVFDKHSVIGFETVLGRDNDLIDVGSGAFVHPVALIHCIQYRNGILGVQIVQEKDSSVSFSIVCENRLSSEDEAIIRRNLTTLAPSLGESKINYVDHLEQTIAGKTKWVIRR